MARALDINMENATTENATMENATMTDEATETATIALLTSLTAPNAILTPSEALAKATEVTANIASQRAAWNGHFEDGLLIGRNEIRIWLLEALGARLSAGRTAAEVRAAVAPMLAECRDIIEDIFVECSRVIACYKN